MNYNHLQRQITRQLIWKYFFRIDIEDVKDCVAQAIYDYVAFTSKGGIVNNAESWLYKVAERKVLRFIQRRQQNPLQDIDDLNENDTIAVHDPPNIKTIEWNDWKFDETEMVATKKGVMYVRIQSDLSQKLYALFLKYLKGNCLVIFLYMLIGWKDEEIQIEMEQRTIEVFRQTRYDCMKKLRAKLIESGDWDDLFGRKWGKFFEDKNKEKEAEDEDEEKGD